LNDVARVDADAHMDLLGFFLLSIVGAELSLDLLRALHGVDDGGKVHQKGITDSFDDHTTMRSHGLLNNLIVDVEQPQHAGFIRAHLPAKAHHVGKHDGRQLASFGSCRRRRLSAHGGDYVVFSSLLSNGIRKEVKSRRTRNERSLL
jgi:hypothetical protein